MEIYDIVVRHPGSAHDSLIFERSAIKTRFEVGEFQGILLGDNGYGNKPYLVTPVINPTTNAEKRYNASHIATRNLIERVFGVWKRRFSPLRTGLRTKLTTSCSIIVALAVLFNIGIQYKENDVVDLPDIPNTDIDFEEIVFVNEEIATFPLLSISEYSEMFYTV
ncbi:putative nuclease HARBI1 [Prorops nasuta]|uniref:putative nuclease HARBI1 n=1 Tax=Prorops nasuta TaxID=863751 RepID=UPI0034CE2CD8